MWLLGVLCTRITNIHAIQYEMIRPELPKPISAKRLDSSRITKNYLCKVL